MTLGIGQGCCCNPTCPQIFDVYPSPSTIQVDFSGNNADNPLLSVVTGLSKDELTFDNYGISAVLNKTVGGCPSSTGSAPSGCEPPYPTVGCCQYYTLAWDDYVVNHKYYSWSGGAWVYNAPLSQGRTYPAHKIIQCSLYYYDATGEWWALVKGYIQYTFNSIALLWRGASLISTSALTSGTYSVTMNTACAPTCGDDLAYPSPPSGVTWPTGVTSAGTATITVF